MRAASWVAAGCRHTTFFVWWLPADVGLPSGELLGESLVFGRAVYMRRLVRNTLLKGLFGGVSLEVGRINRPVLAGGTSGTLTAGSIFLATDTPVGPVYLGLGLARGGNRALYLYLGAP